MWPHINFIENIFIKYETMSFAVIWIGLEMIILNEVCQKEKTNTIWYHLYVESKPQHKWTCLQTEMESQTENRFVLPRERVAGREWEFGDQQLQSTVCVMGNQQGPAVVAGGTIFDILWWITMEKNIYICMYYT